MPMTMFRRAAVAALSLGLLSGSAFAAPALLKSSNASEPLAVEKRFKADATLKRKRLVEVDMATASAVASGLATEVTLQLFDGVSITLKRKSAEISLGGAVVWSAEGSGNATGILVVRGGRVTGAIEAGGKSYLIEPTGAGNLHRVREIDQDAFPNDVHLDISRAPKSGKGGGKGGGGTTPPPPPPPSGTVLEVNLLAAYTARANNLLGGTPADRIALDVAIVNQGYVNSGVPLHLNLVGVAAVSSAYDERVFSDYAQPLYDLTSGTSYNFPAIRDQRNTLLADLVTMYADRSEYCGIAWLVGATPSASLAFSAINPACNGTATLAHELGHNMSLRHDRYVEAAAGSDVYNYGYVSTAGKFRDIMSYNNACTALGFSCPRITYYSNAVLTYSGYPLGIPQGTTGAADATRKLSENAAAVSAFR